jgi:CRISPR-associated protein Csd1
VCIVPQGVKKTSGIAANLLWDTVNYVLGTVSAAKSKTLQSSPAKLDKEHERAQQAHAAFIQRIRETFPDPTVDAGIQAVLNFLETGDFQTVYQHHLWQEVSESTGVISFQLQGDTELVCERPTVRNAVTRQQADGTLAERCMVTGELDVIERLHPVIKGVWGRRVQVPISFPITWTPSIRMARSSVSMHR